jgi:DNA-binding response OmpR family regulator
MKRVLVVDDRPEFLRMIERVLETHGHKPLLAADTKQAIEGVDEADLILLDVVLGLENGWDTLRKLRERTAAPIVVMSGADVDDEMRRDALALGAQDVLQKPFDVDSLLSCLARLLGAP